MIMVVGGFVIFKYLMVKIKKVFEFCIIVVSFNEFGCVICDGVVNIGFFFKNILCWVVRCMYGISMCVEFDSDIYFESLVKYIDGVKYCNYLFFIFVKVGSMVEMDFL